MQSSSLVYQKGSIIALTVLVYQSKNVDICEDFGGISKLVVGQCTKLLSKETCLTL